MTAKFEQLYHEKSLHFLDEDDINYIIKANKLDTNKISDGYHTFSELYDHRIELFIALCERESKLGNWWPGANDVWRSRKHSDGTEWEGWFILGINKKQGEQITYHLPISKWDDCDFAETRILAPEFDGHTAADVLERLKTI